MNATDPFEAELQRLKPAQAPPEFAARLRGSLRPQPAASASGFAGDPGPLPVFWKQWLRLLMPATALAALALLVLRAGFLSGPLVKENVHNPPLATSSPLKADDVRIDRELVGSFDAVARLPGGEPVRFRCQEWVDQVVWRDKERGVTVEQRAPRIELIPVRFETY